jgi:hypothetical protein
LFNLNFNHSFNQTYIFPNQPQLKTLFIKILFSNHNHKATTIPNTLENVFGIVVAFVVVVEKKTVLFVRFLLKNSMFG